MKNTSLLQEEKRATLLFMWLFYIVFFLYDIFYYNFLPFFPWALELPDKIWYYLSFVKHFIIICLIPVTIYFFKKGKPENVKYILVITYLITNLVTDIYYYFGNQESYSSGNLVEVVIILFSPIFINKRFFYLVTLGIILKYIVVGVFIQDPVVFFPVILNILLAFIAYMLLHRFLIYVQALKDSYNEQLAGIVKGVIATLELKDPYTRGHSERVAEYAISLAKATEQVKESNYNHFYYACLLHDIGKVNIPDSILTKSSKLTDEEYEIIKTHPVVGAKAIKDVEGIADHIAVVYHHHERWDGKGYPDGLKGEETPLVARITAIADAFDAMTSTRSYRPALPFGEAYQRVIDGKGTQFDPKLVETFKQVYPDWMTIFKKYNKDQSLKEGSNHENP
ncbi:HD domain-containing protein [Oceanobacillus caeni]|uniref:HD-GYP domain-containing protein n=1 Tax=Oceanobacillus TaxID=182709 RepID=UPI000622B0E9|nr:HD-GYP domain-containing protein [Oceanobacillus caeni]KKE78791.1 metal-dependent phosphohydrolase [Bacilli bacterium VT-13-104]PZD84628.1 HD domain-containing protein [Bacilli bacterium]MCR1834782.1 HD domain-containing protein [Oceanobacillus caeni]MED4474456.1 HD-GYP domain-containing protein [Oceanobacillus caeni]PZD89200.1 HD domain-containing protein [Bacilli bacterium]